MNDNPYLASLYKVLPRLLALYDNNSASPTYGIGDRFYWAWTLIDFANATIQGGANGLARLIQLNLLPDYISEKSIINRIDCIIKATAKLSYKNGSVDQAFPYEASYCGTALVLYDLLIAIELLDKKLSTEQKSTYLNILCPMARYLNNNIETHGFISNHLAVSSAALLKWHRLTGESGKQKGLDILNMILNKQNSEGWFYEYNGADPGYETLCISYLAEIDKMHPELNLTASVKKSLSYMSHFVQPDGSFGGVFGARTTRFYYPAGIEYFSDRIENARDIASFMRDSIRNLLCPTLETMDTPNLVPMFNSYCRAAEFYSDVNESKNYKLPCFTQKPFRKNFDESGIIIDRGDRHYSIISTHKGGVVYHYTDNKLAVLNTGIVVTTKKGKDFTNQIYNKKNVVQLEPHTISITSEFKPVRCMTPTPLQFGILRLLNVSIMRIPTIREKIKQLLAYFLITAKGKTIGYATRTITLSEKLKINDSLSIPKKYKIKDIKHPFIAIHMASQGYWQKQDDSFYEHI